MPITLYKSITLALLSLATSLIYAQPSQPNIIIFIVDDMGLMDTSVPMLTDDQGNPKTYPLNELYRTPNMARLAERGARFSTFYAQSVCSPSRISILTGQNAARHLSTTWIRPNGNNRGKFGPTDWNWEGLGKDDNTLPRVLSEHGYRTFHVGKAHFGPEKHEGEDPLNLGFDINIAGGAMGQPGSYYGEENYDNKKRDTHDVPHLEKYHGTDTFLTEALTLEASQLIRESAEANTPFFLHLSHYALHTPFSIDPRFENNYADRDLPGNTLKFATLVEGMDKSLGDVIDLLEQLEIAENTLILFLGDNGSDAPGTPHAISSSAPLRGKKGTHYEGGMRVPFIVSWARPNANNPLQQRLQISSGFIQNKIGTIMDIFPTILDLAEAPKPESHIVDGKNLGPFLSGDSVVTSDETFLMHFPHAHRSEYYTVYRNGDWKLIYHYFPGRSKNQPEPYELFNLKEDPTESENLADSHPEKLVAMIQEMTAQLEFEGALFPERDGQPIPPTLP